VRTDFHSFAVAAYLKTHPGQTFWENWHHRVMTKAISDRLRWGGGRLTISAPPRSLKSFVCSVAMPAFVFGHNPAAKFVASSYGENLSADLCAQMRAVIESPFFGRLFPATRLSTKSRSLLKTTQGGSYFATSIEGATTGFGGDYIIVDDPLSAANAHSPVERDKANAYFDQVLMTRLNDPGGGLVLVVGQRLNEGDLIGHLQGRVDWDHLELPAIAPEDIHISSDVGGPYYFRKGELLHPARMSLRYLEEKRQSMGLAAYLAQFLQAPASLDGTMIMRAWLVYYDCPPSREHGVVTLSLDTATKTDPANDYSACSVWLEHGGIHHVLDVWRDRVTYPDLKQKVRELWADHKADHLLIEDQGSGSALIQELRTLGIPAIPCKTRDSKVTRLSTASDYLRQGLVSLPRHAAWLAEFEAELLGFPGAKHDDQVDTLTQYLGWVRERPESTFESDFGTQDFSHDGIARSLLAARWG
jgi:predicted phage terminase large subunit-like protein